MLPPKETKTSPVAVRPTDEIDLDPPEPRWPALVAVLAVGASNLALPNSLSVGPRWLLLVIVGLLSIPLVITHNRGHQRMNHLLGQLTAAIVTIFMVWSLVLLIVALPSHKETPIELLKSAALLWITNVLVFASWYWRLDAGGPNVRDMRGVHCSGAFLFPQMTLAPEHAEEGAGPVWAPQFVDYLFLAFNTSTALSPADTAVLSRWAKMLSMTQASISLTIIVILAARAVNIL
ncbi:MAG TPA: hypothetical protein VKT77_15860 [Chthonomonadaceae bacterium]|nr:hypothetical protein [Chthonomonadaceae bacterium]